MRPMIRTDIHAINAIDAEQLAADREWDHTDLTYLQALTELAATAHARITATIHAIAQLRVSQSARTAMSPMSRPPVSMPIWSHTPGWANRTLRIWAMSARALSRGYGVSHDW